jgi:hypothetical protein
MDGRNSCVGVKREAEGLVLNAAIPVLRASSAAVVLLDVRLATSPGNFYRTTLLRYCQKKA